MLINAMCSYLIRSFPHPLVRSSAHLLAPSPASTHHPLVPSSTRSSFACSILPSSVHHLVRSSPRFLFKIPPNLNFIFFKTPLFFKVAFPWEP